MLVRYRGGVDTTRRAALASLVNAVTSDRLSRLAPSTVRMKPPRGISVELALKRLRRQADILYAEPDYRVEPALVANDTYYANGSLWGMYGDAGVPANAFGSAAGSRANGHTGSSQVYVGIVDQGVQYNHPDLAANVWTNPFEIANDRRDNDGNGYVDDVHGWDFANKDASVYDGGSAATVDDHGTHVAGTIGAFGGNNAGVRRELARDDDPDQVDGRPGRPHFGRHQGAGLPDGPPLATWAEHCRREQLVGWRRL